MIDYETHPIAPLGERLSVSGRDRLDIDAESGEGPGEGPSSGGGLGKLGEEGRAEHSMEEGEIGVGRSWKVVERRKPLSSFSSRSVRSRSQRCTSNIERVTEVDMLDLIGVSLNR